MTLNVTMDRGNRGVHATESASRGCYVVVDLGKVLVDTGKCVALTSKLCIDIGESSGLIFEAVAHIGQDVDVTFNIVADVFDIG